MSSSFINNLRRSYDSHQIEKDSHSKSKVYTFNQSQNDSLIQISPLQQRQLYGMPSIKNITSTEKQHSHKFRNQISYQVKNQMPQGPLEINRYLKEYQYNCYQISGEKEQDLYIMENSGKKISKKHGRPNFHKSTKKLQQKQIDQQLKFLVQKDQKKMMILPFRERFFNNFSIENYKVPYLSFSKQQLEQKDDENSDETVKEKYWKQNKTYQSICSREQISLIKVLREQINQLNNQIQKKTIRIQILQEKIENHLLDRKEVQKAVQQNTRLLEENLRNLELHNKINLQKIAQYQGQLNAWGNAVQKILTLLNDFQFNGNFISCQKSQLIQKKVQLLLNQLSNESSELTTYKRFITKIRQMKDKIDSNSNFKQPSWCNRGNNVSHQETDLKNLWKWLKKIGKEYEIMKQKVQAFKFEKNDFILNK